MSEFKESTWKRSGVGIINTDQNQYMTLMKQRQAMERKDDEIDMLKTNINILTNRLTLMQESIDKLLNQLDKSN